MKSTVLIALSLGLVSCAAPRHSPGSKPEASSAALKAKCESCGAVLQYAGTFDELDYSLIASFCDGYKLQKRVFWKAPHGPTPSCSSTYDSDPRWEYLHGEMPALRRDTFESFKQRNTPLPAHQGSEDAAARHGIVIVRDDSDTCRLTRGGFSASRQQALIYSGGGVMHLFERKGDQWQEADRCVLWIP